MTVSLHQLLKTMVEKGGTDLHITTNSPPIIRVDGSLVTLSHPPMTAEQMDHLFGCSPGEREKVFGCSQFFNHRWNDPTALATIVPFALLFLVAAAVAAAFGAIMAAGLAAS